MMCSAELVQAVKDMPLVVLLLAQTAVILALVRLLLKIRNGAGK
jgi:hypothetical protein